MADNGIRKGRSVNSEIDILSITKPLAQKEYKCAWSHEEPHYIPKGRKYVRAVYEDLQGEMQSDHICIECWSK